MACCTCTIPSYLFSASACSVFCHVLQLGSVPPSLWASAHVTPLLRAPSRACSLHLCPPPPCPSHLLRSISTCLLLDIVRDQPMQTPFSTLPFQLTSSSIWPMEIPGRKLRGQGEGWNSGNCLHRPQLAKQSTSQQYLYHLPGFSICTWPLPLCSQLSPLALVLGFNTRSPQALGWLQLTAVDDLWKHPCPVCSSHPSNS